MIARGCVRGVRAGLVEVCIPGAAVGNTVRIGEGVRAPLGTIREITQLSGYVELRASSDGIRRGASVRSTLGVDALPLGACGFGRAWDAYGVPLDGGPPLRGRAVDVAASSPSVDQRRPIAQPLWTGVKAIDALLTIGRGARVGIFGAPGLGKSTLLETIAAGVRADAVVIALVGERGREAQQWIARCDRRMSIICATSDRPAQERVRAAHVALAHARALADRGLDVLLVLDSFARLALAAREVAVAKGMSSGRGGYPPAVFAELAAVAERCGLLAEGSITLVATVLSDGDERDPASEAARALFDGHIELDAARAQAGRFPAINIVRSASRTMGAVVEPSHSRAAACVREALATLAQTADARSLGLLPSDAPAQSAIACEGPIEALLRQGAVPVPARTTLAMLAEIADTLDAPHEYSG